MTAASSDVDVVKVFEECWKSFVKGYGGERIFNAFCSEADIQLHLASKLLRKLRLPICVNVEFPIQFDVDDFIFQRLNLGRTRRKMEKEKGIIADVVVTNPDNIFPAVIAEIKYSPFIWNYFPIIYAVEGEASKEERQGLKNALPREIERLIAWEKSGPSEAGVASYLTNFDKTIRLLKDFKEKYDESVHAYLCVVDEVYPNLEQTLEKEIAKYNPPMEFTLLFQHYSVREWMEKQLKKLEAMV